MYKLSLWLSMLLCFGTLAAKQGARNYIMCGKQYNIEINDANDFCIETLSNESSSESGIIVKNDEIDLFIQELSILERAYIESNKSIQEVTAPYSYIALPNILQTRRTIYANNGLSNRPNTISGFGITDAYTQTQINNALALKSNIASPTFTGTVTAPTFVGALTGTATNASNASKLGNVLAASYALKSDIPSLSGYATTSSLSNYALKSGTSNIKIYSSASSLLNLGYEIEYTGSLVYPITKTIYGFNSITRQLSNDSYITIGLPSSGGTLALAENTAAKKATSTTYGGVKMSMSNGVLTITTND